MKWYESIPWIISLLMLWLSYKNYDRSGDVQRQQTERTEHDALKDLDKSLLKANMKLDQVCSTTNETRTDIKALNKDIKDIDKRVTIVERDLKTAFRYIDQMKGGRDGDKEKEEEKEVDHADAG